MGDLEAEKEHHGLYKIDFERLLEWAGPVPRTVHASIHDLFVGQASAQPWAQAVHAWDGDWQYKEVESLSRVLASQLADCGIGRGDIVPFCFHKSRWVAIAMLGILRAGAACAALDPEMPHDRLRLLTDQIQAKVAMAGWNTKDVVEALGLHTIMLDESFHARTMSGTLVQACKPHDTAVVQFTSGSTGHPKVVVLSHEALCSSFEAFGSQWGIGPSSRVLQFAAHTFDVSIADFLGTLTRGGCVCVPSPQDRLGDLAGFIRRSRVNWTLLTPTMAKLLDPVDVPGLRTLVLGGEAVQRENLTKWAGQCRLILAYGLAEAAIYCSGREDNTPESNPANIGRPIGCKFWVCDDQSLPVPPGGKGELFIEGPILAQSYLHDETKTASTFVPTPTWLEPYTEARRLLKTRDVVQWQSDGSLHFLARTDDQVKLRGIRMELGEITHYVQLGLAGLTEDAVIEVANDQSDSATSRLVAFFVPHGNQAQGMSGDTPLVLSMAEEWTSVVRKAITFVLTKLPSNMVPMVFIPLSHIPTTPAGKCNRQILRAILQEQAVDLHNYIFDDAKECVQVAREQTHLEAKEVPRMASPQIDERYFSELSLGTLKREVAQMCHISDTDIEDVYPCTPMQEALLTSSTRAANAYSRQMLYTLRESLDLPRFKQAWKVTLAENPILRTRIVKTSLGSAQVVTATIPPWATFQTRDECLESDKLQTSKAGAPLIRLAVISNLEFVLTIHHAILDGWSLGLIWQHVSEAYNGQRLSMRTPFKRFVAYCHNMRKDVAARFWSSRLAARSDDHFPAAGSSKAKSPYATARRSILIDSTSITRRGFTVPALLQAAWSVVTATYGNTTRPTFGLTVSGRNADLAGIETMCGPVIATVPFQVPLRHGMSVDDLLSDVQRMALQMIPYEQLGLREISKAGDAAASSVDFQALLVVQPDSSMGALINSLGLIPVPIPDSELTTYSLTLDCHLSHNGVEVITYFDTGVLASEQVERVLQQFEHTIYTVSSAPGQSPLSTLPLCNDRDRAELQRWNSRTAATTIPFESVCEMFRQVALRQPHNAAIDAWDGTLTYQELDMYSESLAEELRARGAAPGKPVPFIFRKTKWTTVAVMGILKAQSFCVPIDPKSPDVRKVSIISGVDAKLVLASCKGAFTPIDGVQELVADQKLIDTMPIVTTIPVTTLSPTTNAYIIFTSGSTSTAKGVVWPHSTLSASLQTLGRFFGFGQGTRTLQFASHVFDISVLEMLGTVSFGGLVCVPSDEDRLTNLDAFMHDKAVTWAGLTPTVSRDIDPLRVPSLDTLVSIGEPIRLSVIEKWRKAVRLFNGYGPCEACIFSTIAQVEDGSRFPESLGFPVGCAVWLVHRDNIDELVPIGAIGEMVIEGPNVGSGYFRESSTATAAFCEPPKWALAHQASSVMGQFFRTGDMARYNADGSLHFLGRRDDDQVKINGQRLQLVDVEQALTTCDGIRRAVALVPKSGDLEGSLTVVADFESSSTTTRAVLQPLQRQKHEEASAVFARASSSTSASLSSFMVPTYWVMVQALPLTFSGKLDRQRIAAWLASSTEEVKTSIWSTNRPMSNTHEDFVRQVWSSVLNIPVDEIDSASSFIRLGGDSISAMSVASKCRQSKIPLNVADILQSRNLGQLVSKMVDRQKEDGHVAKDRALDNGPYLSANVTVTNGMLSPIQSLLCQDQGPATANHFNQSWVFELARPVSVSTLQDSVTALVRHHDMLRCRFVQSNPTTWTQEIIPAIDLPPSLFEHRYVRCLAEAQQAIDAKEAALDIKAGSVFAVTYIESSDGNFPNGVLHLTAHHLVIDLVSWRALLEDFTALLAEGHQTALPEVFPFNTWVRLQAEHITKQRHLQDDQLPAADAHFWGLAESPNLYGDNVSRTIALDVETTAKLTGPCNHAYSTSTLDLLLTGLVVSFAKVFPDRGTPALYNEGHGRETWDSSFDLSRTIGWFTTLSPINPNIDSSTSLSSTARKTKDARLKHSHNGWKFFTSRMLSDGPLSRRDIEIVFNFAGQFQQFESTHSLLRRVDSDKLRCNPIADDVEMLGLISITAMLVEGRMKFELHCNKHMNHLDRIDSWMRELKITLMALAITLDGREAQLSVSQVSALQLDGDDMESLQVALTDVGLTASGLESIYACSPVQEGIILAQERAHCQYLVQASFGISSKRNGGRVSVDRLVEAWKTLCAQHPIMRTIFIGHPSSHGGYCQVVLREHEPLVALHSVKTPCDIVQMLRTLPEQALGSSQPQHHLAILQNGTEVYIRLEMSHALNDAATIQLIWQELARIYDGGEDDKRGNYADYLAWVEANRMSALEFWRSHLADYGPCHFPKMQRSDDGDGTAELDGMAQASVPHVEVTKTLAFCAEHDLTVSTLLQVAWILALSALTGRDAPCCGFLANGRDANVDGIETMMGPTISLLTSSLSLLGNERVLDLLTRAQERFVDGLAHQAVSMAELHHALDLGGRPLFNTAISLQRLWAEDLAGDEASIEINMLDYADPSEFDVVLAVAYSKDDIRTTLKYKRSHMDETMAAAVAKGLADIIYHIVVEPNACTAEILGSGREGPVLRRLQPRERMREHEDQGQIVQARPLSPIEQSLQQIWSEVLELPIALVDVNESYTRLGGDSVSAIRIASKCRALRLKVTVQDILTCKRISTLAKHVEHHQAPVDEPGACFPLGAIQRLTLLNRDSPQHHHALGFLLRLCRVVEPERLQDAIKALVSRHDMLRARFIQRDGIWMQYISSWDDQSAIVSQISVGDFNELELEILAMQKSLNACSGPVFFAALCYVGDEQHLFLTAHHLVSDPVSLQIILEDLELLLSGEKLSPNTSLSFQSWCTQQSSRTGTLRLSDALPYKVPESNYQYWGMDMASNRSQYIATRRFVLDHTTSSRLLSHIAPLGNIMVAALLLSFLECFPDRASPPAIFTDHHGRNMTPTTRGSHEPDIFRTVGWFNSLFPIALQPGLACDDMEAILTQVEAMHRSLPRHGSDYLDAALLTSSGYEKFGASHFPMEIMCDSTHYGGVYNVLEKPISIFERVSGDLIDLHLAGGDFEGAALIGVSMEIVEGRLRVQIAHSSKIQRQEQIRKWVEELERVLVELVA
ncbi:hypothetical protein PRZ48_008170 [Zasmidium cellare]|uniref:Carrier domain-containing protein n=1 Tax=Zasmidium cellare TaxID=395010 RepID=A0ABR0EEQ8_ZASCE|nr:hypothetical protein PRZ48_008170 [Zasmidium cellare]